MECKICFEKYNEKERKPKIITSCGHTFCEYCLRKLTKCPTCVRQIAGTMTNYDTLDFTNNNISTSEGSKTKSEGPNRLSPERLNLKKEIEENKKKLSLKADEQLKKSYEIIQLIKATASREIERKSVSRPKRPRLFGIPKNCWPDTRSSHGFRALRRSKCVE